MGKRKYWDADMTTSYTAEEVQSLGADDKKRIIETWFRSNYEDPAERTPYESREGGYQWIWGGPYDANEEIGSEFSDIVDQELIDETASDLEEECVEWAPTEKPSDYEDTVGLVKSLVLFRFDAFAEIFVDYWVKRYKKSPRPTAIISFLAVVASLLSLVGSIYSYEIGRVQRLEKDQSYSEQFVLLKNTEQNLNDLSAFISSKKSEIVTTKKVIQELEKKKSELEPIVNAKKIVVDAIFLQQRNEIENEIWTERGISFCLGLLASLIATIIWHFVGRIRKGKAKKQR